MYAGRAIESGPARSILSKPAHPYTRCLQLANPSLREERRALYVMPDQMPGLRQLKTMSGCHFAPRCPLVTAECRSLSRRILRSQQTITSPAFMPPACRIFRQPKTRHSAENVRAHRPAGRKSAEALRRRRRVVRRCAKIRGCEAGFLQHRGERVRRTGRPKRQRQEHDCKASRRARTPSGGRILLNGDDLTDRSERNRARRAVRLQMVFQDPQSALNPRRRVASIVTQAMEAGSRHANWDQRVARTRELLAEVGLSIDIGARLPGQLSGGQRQRVNIARALCNIPKNSGRRRDRFRARCFDPGTASQLAGEAALGARLRHAVYLARSFGRPSFVLAGTGDVSRRDRRARRHRLGILEPAAPAYPCPAVVGTAGRSASRLAGARRRNGCS